MNVSRRGALGALCILPPVMSATVAQSAGSQPADHPLPGLLHRAIGDAAPGFALAITGADEPNLFAHGLAVMPEGEAAAVPMTADTRIHVASCSKPLTSMALFHALESQGRDETLTLDEALEGRELHVEVGSLTLAELLCHRSGIAEQNTIDEVLQSSPLPRAHRFRRYSNTNFAILRLVVERLSGETYEEYVRRAVLIPAGITAGHTSAPTAPIATSYRLGAKTGGRPIAFDFSAQAGPFGWYLTALELAQVARVFAKGGIVSPETVQRICERELGWNAVSTPAGTVYCHGGRWIGPGGVGAVSGVAIFPDGRGAGLVVNANTTLDGGDLLADLYNQTTPMIFSYSVPDSGEATIQITVPTWADSVRYTLDGSPATLTSARYSGVVRSPTPGRIKAIAYRDGIPISPTLSHELKVVTRPT